jgi:hypothetical protein
MTSSSSVNNNIGVLDDNNELLVKMLNSFINAVSDGSEFEKQIISCTNDDFKDVILKVVNNNIINLKKIDHIFEDKMNKIKNNLIFDDLDCFKFIHDKYKYDESTFINYIINSVTLYENNINVDIIKWIINTNLEDLTFIIESICNSKYTTNSLNIIKMLIKNDNMTTIFKQIISSDNKQLMKNTIKLFKVSCVKKLKFACNHATSINMINSIFKLYKFNTINTDKIFISSIINKKIIAVKWFIKYFPHKYKAKISKNVIINYSISDYKGVLEQIIDNMFISNKIKVVRKNIEIECCVCYDNKSHMCVLGCHKDHVVCDNCMIKWYNNNSTCPLCRTEINFDECIIHIDVNKI